MKSTISFLMAVVCMMASCKETPVAFSDNNCKASSPFITKLGFDIKKSYFSTSSKFKTGLLLIEGANEKNPSAGNTREYQDSSWTRAGSLAPIQIDNRGNIFVGPAPFIHLYRNSPKEQNTLYRVDAQTGRMEPFIKLPFPEPATAEQNPFGIIGLGFLCETSSLYVSTVAGSDRQQERGVIYQVDAATGKIIDQVNGTDALGLGISYTGGKRKLYFGKARTPEVFSIELDKKGNFKGEPVVEFSLENLGARGDDKVRKIKQDIDGSLLIYGMAFNFNLVPASEKKENIYRFRYNDDEKKWFLASSK